MNEQEEARVLAELMGWELQPPCLGSPLGWWKGSPEEYDVEDWHPHTDIAQAMMVEEQLTPEQWSQYVLELQAIVDVRIWDTELSVIIKCLQATPAQRCTAICAAAMETRKTGDDFSGLDYPYPSQPCGN